MYGVNLVVKTSCTKGKGEHMKYCEMERIEQMKEFLDSKKDFLISKQIGKMRGLYFENAVYVKDALEAGLRKMTLNRNGGRLVIAYLRSSYILRSHEFYIAYYAGEPFVEEEPACIYFNMQPIFKGIDEDLQEIEQKLHEKYIRVFSCEIEEIQRWYMEQIYKNFVYIMVSAMDRIQKGKRIEIYYGEYMGKLKLIGTI